MIGKKYWITSLIFSITIALAMVGGSWDTSLAQGTVPIVPPSPPPAAPPTFFVPVTGEPDLLIPVTGQCYGIITAGIGHTCAITAEDGIRCWGLNDSGQLGDRTYSDSAIPVYVDDVIASDIIDLQSGIKHTCALNSSGEVLCWGLNDSGQLGNGTFTNSNVPVFVQGLIGKAVAISGGAEFTCAVNENDYVMCWGNNSSGQLNDGTNINRSIATLVNPELVSDVLMVSGGQKELQGVTSNGAANYWNTEPSIPVTGLPAETNKFLSADRFDEGGCSTTVGQVVKCWGAIVNAEVEDAILDPRLLDSGRAHACTINEEGLVCWGENNRGQLGIGSLSDSEEAQVVYGIESVCDLAAGLNHTCAVVGEDTIKCWGENTFGQLGDASENDSMLPVDVK